MTTDQAFTALEYATGAVCLAAIIMSVLLVIDTYRYWRKRNDGSDED